MVATTTSARIDIEGQFSFGACCCDRNGGVQVSRATMPAVMSHDMSEHEWNNFCDKLDEALEPMNAVKRILRYMLGGSILISIVIVVLGFVSVGSDNSNVGSWIFFIVAFIFIVLGTGGAVICTNIKTNQSRALLTAVCAEESKRHPTLHFHVRFEVHIVGYHDSYSSMVYNYIEVVVVDPETAVLPVLAPTAAPSLVTVNGNHNFTVTKRLAELEALKFHLTDAEYEQKRNELLASL